jgi:hypothetical protein
MSGKNILRTRILIIVGIIVIVAALAFLFVYIQAMCSSELKSKIHYPDIHSDIQINRFE